MATSEVQIVNVALTILGEDPIASLTDATTAARVANRIFAPQRDALLRSHPWNFATKRATLAQLAEAPAFGFAYQYALPNDYIFVQSLNDNDQSEDVGDRYKVEMSAAGQRVLVTDEGTAQIRYTARVTDPTQFDALFDVALAQKLAAELADTLTNSTTKADFHEKKFSNRLGEARVMDGQEGSSDVSADNSLIDCR